MFSLRLMYIFLSKLWQLFNFLGQSCFLSSIFFSQPNFFLSLIFSSAQFFSGLFSFRIFFFSTQIFFRPILFQDIFFSAHFFLSPCNSVKPAWVAREDWAAAGNEANKHENIIWTWREFILIVPISSLIFFSFFANRFLMEYDSRQHLCDANQHGSN